MAEELTYQEAYECYASYIEDCISFRVSCMEERKDLARATWLKAWRYWDSATQDNLRAWLRKIAVNTAYDYLRREKCHAAVSLEEVTEMCELADGSPSVEIQCESLVLLQSLLDSPYADQVRLLLAHERSLSCEELGEWYGITSKVAKMRVYRARQVLRARFAVEVAS